MHNQPLVVGLFRFDLIVTEEIILPPYKGFAFRGVFGTVLRELACVLPEEECTSCPFRQTCIYAYLFETSPLEGVEGFRRFSNFPRPYIIHPPMGDKRHFRRYDRMQFDFLLIGRASDCLPQVIATFDLIGQHGIRDGQGRFMIEKVTAIAENRAEQIIWQGGTTLETTLPLHTLQCAKQPKKTSDQVLLQFYTPLLIEERGKITYETPRFSLLIEHLGRRIMLLQALHGNGGLSKEQLDDLITLAEKVTISQSTMQWKQMERISNRQQARIKTGGLLGQVCYQGDLTPFMPLLRAGEIVHVGKSTTFGFGGYRLKKPDTTESRRG